MKGRIIGPLSVWEATIMGGIYHNMLEKFAYAQVVDLQANNFCDCLGNPGHVGQNKARKRVQT
jgi:hypothetical protein